MLLIPLLANIKLTIVVPIENIKNRKKSLWPLSNSLRLYIATKIGKRLDTSAIFVINGKVNNYS